MYEFNIIVWYIYLPVYNTSTLLFKEWIRDL